MKLINTLLICRWATGIFYQYEKFGWRNCDKKWAKGGDSDSQHGWIDELSVSPAAEPVLERQIRQSSHYPCRPVGWNCQNNKGLRRRYAQFQFLQYRIATKINKYIYIYFLGDNLGIFVLSEGTLRDQQITSPSLAWLLPSQLFWKPDEPLVFTPERNYSISTLKDFFKWVFLKNNNNSNKKFDRIFSDIDWTVGWEMKKDVEKYALDFTAPGVEVHCAHGKGVQTVEKLQYAKDKFPDSYPG
jgi:Lecithin:cholesterol acyltransferase